MYVCVLVYMYVRMYCRCIYCRYTYRQYTDTVKYVCVYVWVMLVGRKNTFVTTGDPRHLSLILPFPTVTEEDFGTKTRMVG